jgi:hypothetical protein
MASRATRRVADHHHATFKQAIADDPDFTVILARVLDLHSGSGEDDAGVLEATIPEGDFTLRGVIGDA